MAKEVHTGDRPANTEYIVGVVKSGCGLSPVVPIVFLVDEVVALVVTLNLQDWLDRSVCLCSLIFHTTT